MTHGEDTGRRLVWLHQTAAGRALVGGKGASLGRLAELGAPVPPAFALTTRAYDEVAAALGLPGDARAVADADLPGLRARIETTALPEAIRALLEQGFATFAEGRGQPPALAVRSSATAEDSAEFSFAGLHDTILDVRDFGSLERAVKRCWASLWSERAMAYRRSGGLAAERASIAVVVQELVASDVSFVVFTADPINGDHDLLVISATWGLGEAVVSGLVVPDQIVIGEAGRVIDYRIGDKQIMIIPGERAGDGTREAPVPRALRTLPALTHEQAETIGQVARQLAERLGYKADIEGAYAGGTLYLLQARPITTLNPGSSKQ